MTGDIALAVGAAGVHVGQSDLPCRAVRSLVGENGLVGVSASSLEEAVQAQQDGADYIGVGAMFATGTKTDAELVTMEELGASALRCRFPLSSSAASTAAPFRCSGAKESTALRWFQPLSRSPMQRPPPGICGSYGKIDAKRA